MNQGDAVYCRYLDDHTGSGAAPLWRAYLSSGIGQRGRFPRQSLLRSAHHSPRWPARMGRSFRPATPGGHSRQSWSATVLLTRSKGAQGHIVVANTSLSSACDTVAERISRTAKGKPAAPLVDAVLAPSDRPLQTFRSRRLAATRRRNHRPGLWHWPTTTGQPHIQRSVGEPEG